jgi:hypothetical protein
LNRQRNLPRAAAANRFLAPKPARAVLNALWLLAGITASTGAIAERTVTELQPSEVAAFVQKNPKVVVQFTSPDKGCRFCVGADKLFTDGVAQSGKDGWKYVRVQWPRWSQIPEFAPPVKVSGVPDHQVYEGGLYKGSGGGRGKSAEALMATIDKVGVPRAPDAPIRVEMTPEVLTGLRFYALRKVMFGTLHDCERQLHGNKPAYAPKMKGWMEAHAAELKLGTRAMLVTLGSKQHPYMDEMNRQAQQVNEKLATDIGIVQGQPAQLPQCDRLADSLDKF